MGPVAMKEKVIEMGDYSKYGNTVNAFIETSAVVSLYKIALTTPWKSYAMKAADRWRRMLEQLNANIPIDRGYQTIGIRTLGMMARVRLWPLVWVASRIKG